MLGVLAPAPNSLASLPILGGVPLTLATIITAIYVVAYLMMDPIAGGLGALLMLFLLPLGLHSSLGMVSLKAGHLHFLTLGIRLSSQPHCLFSLRYSSSLATAPPFTRGA